MRPAVTTGRKSQPNGALSITDNLNVPNYAQRARAKRDRERERACERARRVGAENAKNIRRHAARAHFARAEQLPSSSAALLPVQLSLLPAVFCLHPSFFSAPGSLRRAVWLFPPLIARRLRALCAAMSYLLSESEKAAKRALAASFLAIWYCDHEQMREGKGGRNGRGGGGYIDRIG